MITKAEMDQLEEYKKDTDSEAYMDYVYELEQKYNTSILLLISDYLDTLTSLD